jgi:hypothetical protein
VSEYVKSTNFTSKDSLAIGNPLKIIKGAEFDTEFNNIATAVATKADLASPALTGTPTAPTPSLSIGGTAIATVAAVQALYPVGSIYINAGVTTNPATLLGFGTWVAFGAGRVMVGLNGSDTLFDALEETGGSKDAIVVSHTHTATSTVTDPGHSHSVNTYTGGNGSRVANTGADTGPYIIGTGTNTATTGITVATTNTSTGSSGTNANLQPYITVAMWKRTA